MVEGQATVALAPASLGGRTGVDSLPAGWLFNPAHLGGLAKRRMTQAQTSIFSPCRRTTRFPSHTGAVMSRIIRSPPVAGRIATSSVNPHRCRIA